MARTTKTVKTAEVSQVKDSFLYSVKFNKLTQGEVLALKHALESYAEVSPVCEDVRQYLTTALAESSDIRTKFLIVGG